MTCARVCGAASWRGRSMLRPTSPRLSGRGYSSAGVSPRRCFWEGCAGSAHQAWWPRSSTTSTASATRETPAVLTSVIEDLAMAAYLPVVAAVVAGRDAATAITVARARCCCVDTHHRPSGGDSASVLFSRRVPPKPFCLPCSASRSSWAGWPSKSRYPLPSAPSWSALPSPDPHRSGLGPWSNPSATSSRPRSSCSSPSRSDLTPSSTSWPLQLRSPSSQAPAS